MVIGYLVGQALSFKRRGAVWSTIFFNKFFFNKFFIFLLDFA